MKNSNTTYLQNTLNKLESFSKKRYFINFLDGFLKVFISIVSFYTFFVLLEKLFNFNTSIRTSLLLLLLIMFLVLFIILAFPSLLKYFKSLSIDEHYKIANDIGKKFNIIKDELINSLQLLNSKNNETKYSPELIESAFQQTYKKIKNIDFNSSINLTKIKRQGRLTFSVLIFCVLFLSFFPGMSGASFRLIHFTKDFTPQPSFSFSVSPGNIQITKNEDVEIHIVVKGEKLKEISLGTKTAEQTGYQFNSLMVNSLNQAKYKIKSVRNSFEYFASAKNIDSKKYQIKVIGRPLVKSLTLKISPPIYSKLPVTLQKDNGNISALKGTKIKVELSSTKNIKSTYLEFKNQKNVNLSTKTNKAFGNFTIKENDNYKIILIDTSGYKNQSPINYEINTLVDEYPKIELVAPQNDVSLSIENRVPLLLKIDDDFGFSALKINYKINSITSPDDGDKFTSINIPFKKKSTNDEINYIWNMTELNLTSKDVLSFNVEIFDNDIISGPKSAKTKTINVRIPSLNELLTKTDNTYNKSVDELKETLKKAEELKKNLQKMAQNLKKNKKKIDWKEQNKLKQSTEKFKELQKKALKTAEKIKKMREKLQKNNLLSGETLEKYLELQKLMDSLSNEEMKKAFEQMQNLLSSMDRKKIQDALKNFKFNEEQFKNSIERTLNLLKRIKVSQKIDELLTRTKDIEKKENDIKKNTANSNPSKNKQLAKKQKQVSKSLDNFKKELEKLNKLMKELSDMPKESLDSLRKEFNKHKNKELSEKISRSLQKNKNQDALQFQQQVSKNMKDMQSMISQLQKEMRQKNQMETFVEMMKSLDDLITLSKNEELLHNQTKNNNTLSSFKNRAKKQNELLRSLRRVMQQLSKLSQKTFAITPEMGKALGDAMKNMTEAITSLQNNNNYLSSQKQIQAMGSLNDASSLLKSSLEGMMKGGGQGGMMSLMQQLGQMAQQQMNLNNLTKGLQHNGKFSQQQLAQLQRLQQQQELIRKSMQELNKEAKNTGKSKSLAADLEEILKRMQEVITNMHNKNVDDNLIQTQERILSKLLDAQRSVNERDYEKRRESFTGKDILRKSPGQLNLDDKEINTLRDELIKAINEGYSKDYEDLIKKYFEQLEKVKGQK